MTGMRILVVDDEPQIQRFLKPALTAAGYEVVQAADGASALKALATAAPDLVILDLGLPDMDGKEVVRNLRGWSRVPVIVLSARDREAERSRRSIWARTTTSRSRSASASSRRASARPFATEPRPRAARRGFPSTAWRSTSSDASSRATASRSTSRPRNTTSCSCSRSMPAAS